MKDSRLSSCLLEVCYEILSNNPTSALLRLPAIVRPQRLTFDVSLYLIKSTLICFWVVRRTASITASIRSNRTLLCSILVWLPSMCSRYFTKTTSSIEPNFPKPSFTYHAFKQILQQADSSKFAKNYGHKTIEVILILDFLPGFSMKRNWLSGKLCANKMFTPLTWTDSLDKLQSIVYGLVRLKADIVISPFDTNLLPNETELWWNTNES